MYTIVNNSKNPYYNLALEEYILKEKSYLGDFIWLWQNRPAVIIGRNQNAYEEINHQFIKEKEIDVVRRISGGGAVYHDMGNINFTFISKNINKSDNMFHQFTEPVISALRNLGVSAEFSGRNDIVVNNKKVSGNAQAYYQDRLYHHGTLLFDSDLDIIEQVLNVGFDKISSKGIKSVRSRVDNIKPYLKTKINIEDFKSYLISYLLGTKDIKQKLYCLNDEEQNKIKKLAEEKYQQWNWNYGRSPSFAFVKSGRFIGGKISFYLNVKKGLIIDCKIYGDFFGSKDIEELAKQFEGIEYSQLAFNKVLDRFPWKDYIYNITKEEIMNCLF